MKKTLLLLSLVFFVFSGYSQISWDWETAETSYEILSWGTVDAVVVQNPMMTHYNMSDSVIMGVTGESAWGWGLGDTLTEDIQYKPESDTTFTIMNIVLIAVIVASLTHVMILVM